MKTNPWRTLTLATILVTHSTFSAKALDILDGHTTGEKSKLNTTIGSYLHNRISHYYGATYWEQHYHATDYKGDKFSIFSSKDYPEGTDNPVLTSVINPWLRSGFSYCGSSDNMAFTIKTYDSSIAISTQIIERTRSPLLRLPAALSYFLKIALEDTPTGCNAVPKNPRVKLCTTPSIPKETNGIWYRFNPFTYGKDDNNTRAIWWTGSAVSKVYHDILTVW